MMSQANLFTTICFVQAKPDHATTAALRMVAVEVERHRVGTGETALADSTTAR